MNEVDNKKPNLILLIEDNPLLAGMYKASFEKLGTRVIIANNGDEGITLAQKENPRCIILDLLMPGTDGFAVLEKIKGNESTKGIKIIVLTAVTKKEELERAKGLGAEECLIKSELTLSEIAGRVSNFLK